MGNKQVIPDYGTIQIKLDKTIFSLGGPIQGVIYMDILENGYLGDQLELKVVGKESAEYIYQEGRKKFNYLVKPKTFFKYKTTLHQFHAVMQGHWSANFNIEPQVQTPSMHYKRDNLECKIQYFLIVSLNKQTKLKHKIYCKQEIRYISLIPQIINKEIEKREVITSHSGCQVFSANNRKPIFTYTWLSQNQLNQNQDFYVKAEIDNKYANNDIKQINVIFYLEFIIKSNYQAMPKVQLGIQKLGPLKAGSDPVFHEIKFNTQNINVPCTSGYQVSSRYYISFQFIFDTFFGTPSMEIMIPVYIYTNNDDSPEQPEIRNFSHGGARLPIKLIDNYNDQTHLVTQLLMDDSCRNQYGTRMAQLNQIMQ